MHKTEKFMYLLLWRVHADVKQVNNTNCRCTDKVGKMATFDCNTPTDAMSQSRGDWKSRVEFRFSLISWAHTLQNNILLQSLSLQTRKSTRHTIQLRLKPQKSVEIVPRVLRFWNAETVCVMGRPAQPSTGGANSLETCSRRPRPLPLFFVGCCSSRKSF